MTEGETTYLIFQNVLSVLSVAAREAINQAATEIRSVVAKHGDAGVFALGLVGAESAAAQDNRTIQDDS